MGFRNNSFQNVCRLCPLQGHKPQQSLRWHQSQKYWLARQRENGKNPRGRTAPDWYNASDRTTEQMWIITRVHLEHEKASFFLRNRLQKSLSSRVHRQQGTGGIGFAEVQLVFWPPVGQPPQHSEHQRLLQQRLGTWERRGDARASLQKELVRQQTASLLRVVPIWWNQVLQRPHGLQRLNYHISHYQDQLSRKGYHQDILRKKEKRIHAYPARSQRH